MKLLIMCEGPNELKIINILLENQKLKFSSNHLRAAFYETASRH